MEPCDKNCNISCRLKIISLWTFWLLKLMNVMSNLESVLQWIHAVIDILKIHHLILNQIGIYSVLPVFDENKQKFSNPWLVCIILKHCGVTRQIPGLTSLLLTLTAKKSTKIKFSSDKIYCNSYHRVPNIINNYVKSPTMTKELYIQNNGNSE